MRIVVTDTVYPDFLDKIYGESPELARAPYQEQLTALLEATFGTSDAYTSGLREQGHEAINLIVDCVPIQLAWARDRGLTGLSSRVGLRLPIKLPMTVRASMLETIARAQISAFDPDVVFIHNMHSMSNRGLDRLRAEGRYLVSQMASILPGPEVYRRYDLLLSSFHHFVRRFREEGVDSEYFPLAFYDRVHSRLAAREVSAEPSSDRPIGLSFIGGIDPRIHPETEMLERIVGRLPIQVWGYGIEQLHDESPIRACHQGVPWGLDMYGILASSKITLNRHGAIAEGQANNMRLFEATGAGAALLTESAWNLEELFEPGLEVVTYEDEDDLVEKANRLLANDDERLGVATAGQRRTLSQHTYRERMAELSAMLEERVPRPVAAA